MQNEWVFSLGFFLLLRGRFASYLHRKQINDKNQYLIQKRKPFT